MGAIGPREEAEILAGPTPTRTEVALGDPALSEAFRHAHYSGHITRVTDHGKPRGAVVSEKDADLLDYLRGKEVPAPQLETLAKTVTPAQLDGMLARLDALKVPGHRTFQERLKEERDQAQTAPRVPTWG